jgi:hypothetical protein
MASWTIIAGGIAEHVILGLGRELLGDDRPGGHIVHYGNLRLLVEALRSLGHAGIDEADGCGDLVLVDEFLRNLHAALVLGFIVALDQLDFSAEHTALGVDLGRGQAHAVTHRNAHRGGAAGEGTGHADLDGVRGQCRPGPNQCDTGGQDLHMGGDCCAHGAVSDLMIILGGSCASLPSADSMVTIR